MTQPMDFDSKLAQECAAAFSGASDLGCTVSDAQGRVLYEAGYGCAACPMCAIAGRQLDQCIHAHIYGMTEAERFGGKYIYFCPMGFTCFVSPILGAEGSAAKITVGPFLMVDRQDYIACDLAQMPGLSGEQRAALELQLQQIPVVDAEKVTRLSTLLFMAVGFMNNVGEANRMLDAQDSDAIQGQITSYIMQLKSEEAPPPYPFDTERALLRAIAQTDKPEAQRLLNELFGYIFFAAGGDFSRAKSRVYELLVLISRTAVDAGADPESTLQLSHTYLQTVPGIRTTEELCFWLTGVMNRFMDSVFNYVDAKHANVIHKTIQHLRVHYAERITLEDMARTVYLSPAYFSRVFKRETGVTFNSYLNSVRVAKSKELLRHDNMRLTDIALLVGFEDQSYFTKVFKRVTGTAPLKYRETKGQNKRA